MYRPARMRALEQARKEDRARQAEFEDDWARPAEVANSRFGAS
jgi:hypothetical protein